MFKHLRTLTLTSVVALMALGVAASPLVTQVARAATNIEACGNVTAYVEPTAGASGLLTIGSQTFALDANAALDSQLSVGANLCASLTLDSSGSVTQLVVLDTQANATLQVCAKVNAYDAASGSESGQLVIGNDSYAIAPGANVSGNIKVNAYTRLRLETNASGKVSDITVLRAGATWAEACASPSGEPSPVPAPPATPKPNTQPTPAATATPRPSAPPTPIIVGGPPSVTYGPGGTPRPGATPTPVIVGGPPVASPGPGATPAPTGSPLPGVPLPPTSAGTPPTGSDECPASGAILGPTGTPPTSGSESMDVVPLAAGMALPAGMFLAGMFSAAFVAGWRRRHRSNRWSPKADPVAA